MTDAPSAVDVCDVSYSPRGLSARDALVSEINFSIEKNERVALVGPNGAGKTTLIRMLVGLETPSAGDIKISGRSLVTMNHAERAKHIAYVGQTDEPDGRLSVLDYVSLGLIPHAKAFAGSSGRNDAMRALTKVDLSHFSDRRLDQLSGGERQRVKIARALCQQPALLVLDEPTNHLDPQTRGEQLELIGSAGIPVIAALHDLTLIDAFADKVAVLVNGRLHAFGPPSEALSMTNVREVFGVDLHRLQHPDREYFLPALDVPLKRPATTTTMSF